MAKKQTKFIFVTGGVLSGVGKGITAASLGTILKARGLEVSIQKCDPYLNVDAGTLNPAEHGECFVTYDGAETDLDLGHYERFLDIEVSKASSLMSGRVLKQVIDDERGGKYLGKTVQIVPHVTAAIQEEILKAAEGSDIHIVEIGGTVGDYEGLSFIEAIRELGMRLGRENAIYMHIVYVPYLNASKEFKTKPAQMAARELRSLGIVPDLLAARSETPIPESQSVIRKLSLFTGVDEAAIALLPNAKTVYQVPLTLEEAGWSDYVLKRLELKGSRRPDLADWRLTAKRATSEYARVLSVGIVAKYLDNEDTYMSVVEALKSAAWKHEVGLTIAWVDAERLTHDNASTVLGQFDGILVPGGFGSRGIEGKITAADYAIENKKPYLGLCLGMQVAVIAHARRLGMKQANSTEFDPDTPDPVITTMLDQVGKEGTGGTMRLGNYTCELEKGTKALEVYGAKSIVERHRHRYEFNNKYLKEYEEAGMVPSGINPENNLVEVIELKKHPFFVGGQFHPELKSTVANPHPLFVNFVAASLAYARKK